MVAASLLVVAQRSPIYSVLLLIASFVALAGLYVLLDAPFLAVIQIIIYAGAIMVLFLVVVMLLNAPSEVAPEDAQRHWPVHGPRRVGALLAVALVVELLWSVWHYAGAQELQATASGGGEAVSSVRDIGRMLFVDYGFAFEVTSILILIAMVGAVVLAKREL